MRRVDVAQLDFPLLRPQAEWSTVRYHPRWPAQQDVGWAQHLVFVFPLWLGDMPALLKAFLEQIARPGFAFKKRRATPSA